MWFDNAASLRVKSWAAINNTQKAINRLESINESAEVLRNCNQGKITELELENHELEQMIAENIAIINKVRISLNK